MSKAIKASRGLGAFLGLAVVTLLILPLSRIYIQPSLKDFSSHGRDFLNLSQVKPTSHVAHNASLPLRRLHPRAEDDDDLPLGVTLSLHAAGCVEMMLSTI